MCVIRGFALTGCLLLRPIDIPSFANQHPKAPKQLRQLDVRVTMEVFDVPQSQYPSRSPSRRFAVPNVAARCS